MGDDVSAVAAAAVTAAAAATSQVGGAIQNRLRHAPRTVAMEVASGLELLNLVGDTAEAALFALGSFLRHLAETIYPTPRAGGAGEFAMGRLRQLGGSCGVADGRVSRIPCEGAIDRFIKG